MVELPSELWYEVFSHLFVVPSASDPSLEEWKNYAQSDLCTIMRVCSAFHDTASSLLYSRTAVLDLPCFLYGFEYTPPRWKSKKDLLSLVQNLRLINPSPVVTEDLVLRLSFSGWGRLVDEDKALIKHSVHSTLEPLLSLLPVLSTHRGTLLPRMKRLTVTSTNEYLWVLLESGCLSGNIREDLHSARQAIPLLLRGATVEWHQHVKHGPFSLTLGTSIEPPKGSRGSAIHHIDQLMCEPPFWINGWVNTFVIDCPYRGIESVVNVVEGHVKAINEEKGVEVIADATRVIYIFPRMNVEPGKGLAGQGELVAETDVDCWLPIEWKGKISVKISQS